MYLFQLLLRFLTSLLATRFTFHYVSISTIYQPRLKVPHLNLHSTMYLFQPMWFARSTLLGKYLHSTMYLFQHPYTNPYKLIMILFTFHYVSISTIIPTSSINSKIWFTFHYVSISTDKLQLRLGDDFIYIPLCIYFNSLEIDFLSA